MVVKLDPLHTSYRFDLSTCNHSDKANFVIVILLLSSEDAAKREREDSIYPYPVCALILSSCVCVLSEVLTIYRLDRNSFSTHGESVLTDGSLFASR